MRVEKGNVLFIILIAVALFGALSYAVTQGMRGGGSDISKDQAGLYADEILDYAKSVEIAVQRMMARGVSENDLCFDIDQYPGGNTTYEHASCSNTRNRVFHPDGGGISYRAPSIDWLDPDFSFVERFQGAINIDSVGTNAAELVWQFNGIREDICKAVNVRANVVDGFGADVPQENNDSATTGNPFTGTFGVGNLADNVGDDGTGLSGKKTFCRNQSSVPIFQFDHVLIAR